jgi:hypothetical protein
MSGFLYYFNISKKTHNFKLNAYFTDIYKVTKTKTSNKIALYS